MIFYRHPTPDAVPGLCYGRWNIGLAPGAEAEIEAACAAPPAFDYIVTSPSWRARMLAEALAKATGAPLEADERLMEMDFGRWEGEFWSEIDRAESDPWAEDPWNLAPPKGESYSMVHSRIGAVLLEAPRNGCFVTHAGPIRAAMMIQRGVSFAEAFADPVPFAEPIDLSLTDDPETSDPKASDLETLDPALPNRAPGDRATGDPATGDRASGDRATGDG